MIKAYEHLDDRRKGFSPSCGITADFMIRIKLHFSMLKKKSFINNIYILTKTYRKLEERRRYNESKT